MYYSYRHVLKIAVRVGAILAAMMIATATQAIDFFVDQNKTTDPGMSGSGLGDWSQAFITLEEALEQAVSGDTIFVAEGTYTPNDASDSGIQTQTYLIDRTLIILGGYEGEGESSPMNRDPKVFLTILSGDFKNPTDAPFVFDREYLTDASRTDNAFTVVTVLGVTRDNPGTRLEGFIIERGNRGTFTGSNATGYRGGGMLIDNSAMDVVNCTFRFNATGVPPDPEIPLDPGVTSDGGGASVRGGQLMTSGEPDYTRFINCTFHDNFSARGGGLAVTDGSLTTIPTQVKVVNCLFYDNQTVLISDLELIAPDGNGGAILVYGLGLGPNHADDFIAKVEVTNCTVSNNNAANATGGLNVSNIVESLETVVQNSVFWGNNENGVDSEGSEITRFGGTSRISVRFSDVQGGLTPSQFLMTEALIDLDPEFVDEANNNFRVPTTSPVVEVGDPNTSIILPDDFDLDGDGDMTEPTPDLDLFPRLFDLDENNEARVDMGAYESFPSCCEDIAGLDHVIDDTDLDALLAAWGACPDPCVSCTINDPDTCIADINRDCQVNVTDLLALLGAWGPCGSNSCNPCP